MAHPELKTQAIALRKQGLSYSEIMARIPVAKSTISDWLHSVGLASHQKQRLTELKIASQKRGAAAKRNQRITRTKQIHTLALEEASSLFRDPLWLAGTMLYWAEGTKEKPWRPSEKVSFVNMEARVILIFRTWILRYGNVHESALTYSIYIHRTGDVEKAKKYWSENLNIKIERLSVYFKKHTLNPQRKNIHADYYGIMKIQVRRSTQLLRRIAGWIDAVVEYVS